MSPKRSPTGAAPRGPSRASPSDGATIFLVEEDDAVRDALAASLRAAGHPVLAFGSGRGFLAAYSSEIPGCLVLDLDLSDMDATDLLRMLGAARTAMPTVVTSRRLIRRTPVGALPPGPLRFLDKPFGSDELLRLIRSALADVAARRPQS